MSYPSQFLRMPASGSARATYSTIAVALAVILIVGFAGNLIIHRFFSPSINDLTRDSCASVIQQAGANADWLPVTATDPETITALMTGNAPGEGDADTPMLVHPIAIHMHGDTNHCPHWVASTHDAHGGHPTVHDFVYDYPHHRMRFVGAAFPTPGHASYATGFPSLSSNKAQQLLRAQRHIGAVSSWIPKLVFFGLQDGWSATGDPDTHVWNGGGTDPLDPMWLMLGNDNTPYLVGASEHVYALDDLPINL